MKPITIEITLAAWAWLQQQAARYDEPDTTPEIVATVLLERAIEEKQARQKEAQQ